MRILVVEDEPLLAGAVAEWLRGDAHAVDVAHNGAAALDRLGVNDYDVVVLDRDLPLVHGDQVCQALVEAGSPTRVLLLTAVSVLVNSLKGVSARRLRAEFPREVNLVLWGGHFWSPSYFAASVGGAPPSVLIDYITSQRRPG